MQYYTRETGQTWHKSPIVSFFCFLRDSVIFLLPIGRIPLFLVKLLYGVYPSFVFFVHPRRTEDTYAAVPFLAFIRRRFGRKVFLRTLRLLPPLSIATIRTPSKIDGLVITSAFLPEMLLKDRKKALLSCIRGLTFASRITKEYSVFGLGGLWPMVTQRGLALRRYVKNKKIIITNGHCGTLISLFLSIQKISEIGNIRLDNLKIAILGVGKMGSNLARVLYGKVAAITLIDISGERLNRVEAKLKEVMAETDIQRYTNKEYVSSISHILSNHHITVCTTSNLRRILKPEQIPDDTIIIDDSRPEAIPRGLNRDNCAVIEGGLMKIKNIRQNYDFGFGIDENVFGCLAESYLLAIDKGQTLANTLGEVDFQNFKNMILSCSRFGVELGDFKCRDAFISEDKLLSILRNKTNLSATIPYKDICWIIKVGDILNLEVKQ